MDKAGIVILAGGEGARMGGRKPERLFRGRRLIDPVLDLASESGVPTVICVREPGQVAEGAVRQVFDRPGMEGPLAGLLAAFDWARSIGLDHFLTLPCDTPFLPNDVFSRLWRAALDAERPAVATSNARRHPTCAVWPVKTLADVEAYAGTGRRSLSGALDACGAISVAWPQSDPDAFVNINTPRDIERHR